MSVTASEIASQPAVWLEAAGRAGELAVAAAGGRIAVIGCGTSYYVAMSIAALRESLGVGETDAFVASEAPLQRPYDHVIAISRSGTTTEVGRALRGCREGVPRTLVTAVAGSPLARDAEHVVVLGVADEASVVQTRFATAVVVLVRAALGEDVGPAARDAELALAADLPVAPGEHDHYVFLGSGWTVGLAFEAALKTREMAQAWSEAYVAMEYRHGPISVAGDHSAVWMLGEPPAGLVSDVARTGATVVHGMLDPLAQVVQAQRVALALAEMRGLDPDRPRNLTRSVVLEQ